MFVLQSFVYLGAASVAAALSVSGTYNCTDMMFPVSISAEAARLNISKPADQVALTAFVTTFLAEPPRLSLVWTQLRQLIKYGPSCVFRTTSVMMVCWSLLYMGIANVLLCRWLEANGTDSIGFDHSYWIFGGEGSPYNYVEAAITAGHAIFIFDRLGNKPDGIREVQFQTEVEVANQLLECLPKKLSFGEIVGVGHSFGSSHLLGLVTEYGNKFDAMVLTGFSSYSGGIPVTIAAFGLTIASIQNSTRFGSLESSYLSTATASNDQTIFFHYGGFEQAIADLASLSKETVTLGELVTQTAGVASNYTNPVLIVTGEKDLVFCGGNCYQPLNGSQNLVNLTQELFPASAFSTYIVPKSGHAVNLHTSAPDTFLLIENWIKQTLP
ncbi:hypothetical protein BD779DRAFT_1672262 [Infundibulicybe gibba]|nr:hypothetical protein BD779DRAFT_1672262 [Infundibulicybe gibba]